jgi:hypothetical protein
MKNASQTQPLQHGSIFLAVFVLLCTLLAYPPTPQAYDPSCTWPTQEPAVVSSTEPQLHISVKWCGISEAPSVDDPTIVCQNPGDFKTMMWRRHERASDSIWIPQCRMTLRSGGAIQKADYLEFADLDTGIGNAGDIVVSPVTEMDDTWEECDQMWSAQPKGIIAISANQLIDNTGTPVARGIAYVGSITRPWAAVADTDNLCQLNERSLAHEVGHILSLSHVTTAGNLMQTGGTGATLTLNQCNTTRTYLQNNTILDPPAGIVQLQNSDLVDFVFDSRGDGDDKARGLDISKVVVMDNSASRGNLHFCIGTDGIPEGDDPITYYLMLDTDNNPNTGGKPAERIGAETIEGVEYLAEVTYTPANRDVEVTFLEPGELAGFVPVLLDPGLITARVRPIDLVICDPFPTFQGPDRLPKFIEIDVIIENNALPLLGLPTGGRVFPEGLMLQSGATAPFTEIIDLAPDKGEVLEFPEIVFPSIQVPKEVNRGQVVPITLEGMPPNAELVVFLGQFKIDVAAETNGGGFAEVEFTVPEDAPFGQTLLTAGVNALNNAMTADTIIQVVEHPVTAVEPRGKRQTTLATIKRNALFQNYPNPFNPDTWIPYQLSADAFVSITIYSNDGAVVRRLKFGQQKAGSYLSRSKAAYWNGRNELGERVPSGIYFYQMRTNDFTSTRKMLIVK